MEASESGNGWEKNLEVAREFDREYERTGQKVYLHLSSIRYYLAHGLCMNEEQRRIIAQEKEGIEAKLRALEKVTNIEDRVKVSIKQLYSPYNQNMLK